MTKDANEILDSLQKEGTSPTERLLANAVAAQIERLRAALTLLKIAVDREGWPAGWNLIRKDVDAALGHQQDSSVTPQENP